MVRHISRIVTLSVVTLVSLAASQVMANDYQHINQLARSIHSQAQELLTETRHYRSTPNYYRLVRDVTELDRLACHLRDVARHEGDLDYLAADIADIDVKFHHIEKLFDKTELAASYGRGFIKGHTAHVKELLDCIEESIHHIGDDIESLRAAVLVPTPVLVAPRAQNAYYGNRYAAPIVTRVETYRVPHGNSYGSYGGRAPYGGKQLHRGYGHNDYRGHNAHRGYDDHRGAGFSIGGGSTRISFRF